MEMQTTRLPAKIPRDTKKKKQTIQPYIMIKSVGCFMVDLYSPSPLLQQLESRDGAMVGAHIYYYCGLSSNVRPSVMWVEFVVVFFSLHRSQHLLFPVRSGSSG